MITANIMEHDDHTAHHGVDGAKLPLWSIIPFIGMLLSIAIVPLINFHFWEHHYGKFSLAWIAIFSIPFLIVYKGDGWYEIVHIVLLDYVPFIILLTALFTCAGGICLKRFFARVPRRQYRTDRNRNRLGKLDGNDRGGHAADSSDTPG